MCTGWDWLTCDTLANRRCLRAALDIPGHGELNVFVTHFSYDRSQQLSNVNEIKDIVAKYPVPQVLMGAQKKKKSLLLGL